MYILHTGNYLNKWVQETINQSLRSIKMEVNRAQKNKGELVLCRPFESILETRLSYKNEVCVDDDLSLAGLKKNSKTIETMFMLQSLVVSQKVRKKSLYACYVN